MRSYKSLPPGLVRRRIEETRAAGCADPQAPVVIFCQGFDVIRRQPVASCIDDGIYQTRAGPGPFLRQLPLRIVETKPLIRRQPHPAILILPDAPDGFAGQPDTGSKVEKPIASVKTANALVRPKPQGAIAGLKHRRDRVRRQAVLVRIVPPTPLFEGREGEVQIGQLLTVLHLDLHVPAPFRFRESARHVGLQLVTTGHGLGKTEPSPVVRDHGERRATGTRNWQCLDHHCRQGAAIQRSHVTGKRRRVE